MRVIRTVLGDIAPERLGRVDYHEHLFQVSPLLSGDELDDEAASGEEAVSLVGSGFAAMIDATPTGLGRRPESTRRISRDSGLNVVATTGAHRDVHYGSGHWLFDQSAAQLADRFIRDIVEGMPVDDAEALSAERTAVRAGIAKAGLDYWRITPFQHRVLEALGAVHQVTGAPVMVHLEHGSAAFEVIEQLAGFGVDREAIVLAHIDRAPDAGMHSELAASGVYLGYDGFARTRTWPDSFLLDCMGSVIEAGHGDRILIGGDVARRRRYSAYGGMPGLAYLGDRVVPRILNEHGETVTGRILVDNPARFLARDYHTRQPALEDS